MFFHDFCDPPLEEGSCSLIIFVVIYVKTALTSVFRCISLAGDAETVLRNILNIGEYYDFNVVEFVVAKKEAGFHQRCILCRIYYLMLRLFFSGISVQNQNYRKIIRI